MVDLLHDIALYLDVFHLIRLHHIIFLERLDCKDLLCVFFLSHIDFGKASSSNHLEQFKIFYLDLHLVARCTLSEVDLGALIHR